MTGVFTHIFSCLFPLTVLVPLFFFFSSTSREETQQIRKLINKQRVVNHVPDKQPGQDFMPL